MLNICHDAMTRVDCPKGSKEEKSRNGHRLTDSSGSADPQIP